jgi:hypothetical protein
MGEPRGQVFQMFLFPSYLLCIVWGEIGSPAEKRGSMLSIDVLGTIDHGASKLSVSVSSVTSQSFLTYSQNELINKQLPEVLCGGNTVTGLFWVL